MDQKFFEHVLQISQRMAETRTLKPLLNYVIDEAIALVGAEHGYIVLAQPDGRLDIRVKRGQGGQEIEDAADQISHSIFNEVMQTGKPLILRDAFNDPNFSTVQSVVILKLRSIMCVPLITHGETLGAIYVENRAIRNRFKEEDLPPLTLFANQAAVAIENATLNDELEARVAARTKALERSNRELQNFARVASHDLQEPLRKVQVFGDRLQQRCDALLDETGHDYLNRMQSAVSRMQALIQNLLIYSRVTTTTQPFEAIDLSQIVREVLSDLEIKIEQVGGRVEVADLPTIEADPTQMRQLFQNLIGNALKFHRAEEAPLVNIRAKSVTLSDINLNKIAEGDQMCQIVVSDNGIGFEEAYVEQIFQVFQRLHNRTEYPGTGVGLAICRSIVERHQGYIIAQSQPNQGTQFIITLPFKQDPQDQMELQPNS